jgi:hypothetical protein
MATRSLRTRSLSPTPVTTPAAKTRLHQQLSIFSKAYSQDSLKNRLFLENSQFLENCLLNRLFSYFQKIGYF